MAELGGMLASAILKVVSDQIVSVIDGQITLQKKFGKDLKKMKMALESVDAVLEDAGRRSITDKSTRLWLKRLKDVMYAISDMIDQFEADTEAVSQPYAHKFSFKKYLATMVPCLTIGSRITMANKMDEMRKDLEEITNQHKNFNLTEGPSANEPQVIDTRETSSIMETQIVGRNDDKENILACLVESMTKDITILPIYGIGGLGKTTLAKMIYNSSQFKDYSQVWVYVSQTFDLKKIGNSIITQLSDKKKESEYTGMEMIHKSLQKLLSDKKILIVLDDLWQGDQSHLESLVDMLRVGKGSNVVVIVTTRDEGIAKNICTIQPYKLAKLTDDMCWSIIKQKSAFESRGDKEQLQKIGKVIATKCAGVALAARSLGHMLKTMKFGEWELVRDSNIWTSSTQVLASLKLSYSVMASYFKLCFVYCAIFPKGHKIVKDDLIHQWVSLGFCTWQHGETYIRELLGLSFLEHSMSSSVSTIKLDDEDITLLTMHDLVHDLARSVMDDEILVICKGNNADGRCYHYALLDDCSKPFGLELSKIRALRFTDCDKTELHDAAFSSAKSLRVLDLSECSIHKLPNSIGVLKHLRYLNAPSVQDAIIPNSITRLSRLIYLNLCGSCKILALPESIGEIAGLQYLNLSGCSGIEKLPESFGRLKALLHLDLSNCSCIGGISSFLGSLTQLEYLNLSYCPNIGELPEALGGLSKLRYLNLSFSSYLECCKEAEVLGALNKLEYLNLSSEGCGLLKLPEALGRFTELKYLNLSGCQSMTELPRLSGSVKKLVHLDLSNCLTVGHLDEALVGLSEMQYLNLNNVSVSSLPDGLTKVRYLNLSSLKITEDRFDSLINHISGKLSDLEYLDLSRNYSIKSIPESLCNLRNLHTLDLSGCRYLQKIPINIGTIEKLKFLYFNGCPFLSELPRLGKSAVSLPHFEVQPGNSDCSSNLVQLQQVDPEVLEISKLENVKCIGEAQRINLMDKNRLYDLKLEWTGDAMRFVDDKLLLEKLKPPSTLKELVICGYNGDSFPAWLVLDQLTNLERLVISGMANLEELNITYSSVEVEDHVLQSLVIHDCPKLRMNRLLPKAKQWMISNSDNVLSSWEECTLPYTSERSPEVIRHLSSLETLCLEDTDMEELPKWTGDLTSLRDLTISRCTGLKGLNEKMRQLTNLRSLQLRYCDSMVSLPHWLGELTSLKRLVLWQCDVLRSLPESIQQLIGLKKLQIVSCHQLKHVVESEEGNMTKLTHNKDRVCLLPSSLEELQIGNCNGIKSLPEGMEQLTKLKKLDIRGCPELKQWCEIEENQMKLAHIKEKGLY